MEISDRYSAVGIDDPNPKTVCGGECEGMGMIPVCINDEDDAALIKLWKEAEAKEKSDDGYHFVICPTCNGSGNKD